MATILTIDDFENGRYKIPVNQSQETDLNDKIKFVEDNYLPCLLGVELYDLFIIDYFTTPIVNEPTEARFKKIFDTFNYQNDGCDLIVQSGGIKDLLKGIIYYLYTRDEVTRITTVGIKKTDSENSQNISAIKHDINARYNDSIKTYKAIQFYICDTVEFDYPEFKGIDKKINHIF